MLASSGYVSVVDSESCIGCGICSDFCQFAAIQVVDGVAIVNLEQCMGCGVCVSRCEQGAVSLRLEPAKGVPLDICEVKRQQPVAAGQFPDAEL